MSFHSLARLSTLVPTTQSWPDLTHSVLISDVAVTSSVFKLVLKWSKTQQLLKNKLVVPLFKAERQGYMCPVVKVDCLLICCQGYQLIHLCLHGFM